MSAVLPLYKQTVELESLSRTNELWKRSTDWRQVALGYAQIGLLDPLKELVENKLSRTRPNFQWTLHYNAFCALHELARMDLPKARIYWTEVASSLDKLRSWSPRFDVFMPSFQVRPAFGFQELTTMPTGPDRTVSFGFMPDGVARDLDGDSGSWPIASPDVRRMSW